MLPLAAKIQDGVSFCGYIRRNAGADVGQRSRYLLCRFHFSLASCSISNT